MKKSVIISLLTLGFGPLGAVHAASFASSFVDYASGTLPVPYATYNDPNAALGQPRDLVGADSGFPSVFSPFDPHYENTDIVGIGVGGQLTLQLANFVTVQPGAFEIGVWSNVGLQDGSAPAYIGTATSPASTLSPPNSAVVSVSADGTHWVTLNGGNQITFSLPGIYYSNAGPYDSAAPASPQYADFGKPFTGALADFSGETYSQIVTTLNGTAGGTWLDLDGTGLSQVGYIRFSNVPSGQTLFLDGVSTNSTLTAGPVPEPATAGLLCFGGILALGLRRQGRAS